MDEIQAISISKSAFSCSHVHLPLKRTFDILFSLVMLILFSPVYLMIMTAIRITSSGPLIYTHERIGRGGKPFRCFKFRTMYEDADLRLHNILENDPLLQKEWDETYKLQVDPRVTPIGRFLRKTSLDEFPQFLNVLKGDMSVVGPRPVVQEEIEKYLKEKAFKVLSVRPGITGIWQVSGRSMTSYEERIKLDELYIETRNFVLDLALIAKTIPAILSYRGAY